MIHMSVIGAKLVAADFASTAADAGAVATRIVRHHGRLLQTRVKARASGRPGPRTVTGDYRRSIGMQMRGSAEVGTVSAVVGTNKPQGRRLEFGFVGADSAGRVYDQPPYPHFGPAFDETVEQFLDDLYNAVVD